VSDVTKPGGVLAEVLTTGGQCSNPWLDNCLGEDWLNSNVTQNPE